MGTRAIEENNNAHLEESQPRELSLATVVKVKALSSGRKGNILFGNKRQFKQSNATLVLKTTNNTKYELSFGQQANSIYTPSHDRDEVCRLITEYLKIRNP